MRLSLLTWIQVLFKNVAYSAPTFAYGPVLFPNISHLPSPLPDSMAGSADRVPVPESTVPSSTLKRRNRGSKCHNYNIICFNDTSLNLTPQGYHTLMLDPHYDGFGKGPLVAQNWRRNATKSAQACSWLWTPNHFYIPNSTKQFFEFDFAFMCSFRAPGKVEVKGVVIDNEAWMPDSWQYVFSDMKLERKCGARAGGIAVDRVHNIGYGRVHIRLPVEGWREEMDRWLMAPGLCGRCQMWGRQYGLLENNRTRV
ncbi:hypothetical protein BJ508DRAFT_90178 [Ascobolus immersus RN42]|uniref:Uncharacterized protein n=1 Tax=Ascobolus immersus RN42 TaxID=1160509 RepID=A0A3N4HCV9_ASCIM|nr:hypothetical protein BJ508DRAFT_90178 [Ascobolus immersus RN42]